MKDVIYWYCPLLRPTSSFTMPKSDVCILDKQVEGKRFKARAYSGELSNSVVEHFTLELVQVEHTLVTDYLKAMENIKEV